VALALEKLLGKPVIVDNRAGGAGGSIGNAARRAPMPTAIRADDAVVAGVLRSGPAVRPSVAYEKVSQFAPVRRVLADPTLLAVPASRHGRPCRILSTIARKRPGEIPYGSSGPYGTLHVAM